MERLTHGWAGELGQAHVPGNRLRSNRWVGWVKRLRRVGRVRWRPQRQGHASIASRSEATTHILMEARELAKEETIAADQQVCGQAASWRGKGGRVRRYPSLSVAGETTSPPVVNRTKMTGHPSQVPVVTHLCRMRAICAAGWASLPSSRVISE